MFLEPREAQSVQRLRFDLQQELVFFSLPRSSDRLWGPPSLLFNRYLWIIPGCEVAGA